MAKAKSIIHCSVCRGEGHTKRNCEEAKHAKKERTSVSVQLTSALHISPHVVELGKTHSKEHWQEIEVYNETTQSTAARHTIDIAGMVRRANAPRPAPIVVEPSKAPIDFSRFQEKLRAPFARGLRFIQPRVIIFAIILVVVLTVPFPAMSYYIGLKADTEKVIEESTNAFLSLQSSTVAAFQTNIAQAKYDLNAALNAFSSAESIIDKEYKALLYVVRLLPIVGAKVSSRQELLLAGHHLALGNTYLVKGIDEATNGGEEHFVDRITVALSHIRSAIPQYEAALLRLSKVKTTTLPAEYQETFEEFKVLFATFIDDMKDMTGVMGALQTILGQDDFRRYLVVFQNNHELRPTGGFIGSFAIVDMQKGKVMNIEVPPGGSYDVQGQLDVYVEPPLPLQLANPRWEFQDGNWFPDFAASAQKLAWFYQHSRGTTVDGVIAVNASVLERVLRVVGPIANEEHNVYATAENVLPMLQQKVEDDASKESNTPKAVVGSVLSQLLTIVQSVPPERLFALLTELNAGLTEREIQVYFADKNVQNEARAFGWTGEIIDTAAHQDYAYVVNTNIGGEKSDAQIQQRIEHQAVVEPDGSIIDTVMVSRTHTGSTGEELYGVDNINYLRVYVPKGAELVDAGGFSLPPEEDFLVPPTWYVKDPDLGAIETQEVLHGNSGTRITREFGKTVFGNWVITPPGITSQVYIRYRLPWRVFDMNASYGTLSRYGLVLQKQSGISGEFAHTIIYPDGWVPVWNVDEGAQISRNGATVGGIFDVDKVGGIIMKKVPISYK